MKKFLKLGHSNLTSGHFGTKKMFARISQHFIWPNLWMDVKSYVNILCVKKQLGTVMLAATALCV